MDYGIIGMPLGHSFSKPIHESISPITYEINPLDEDGVRKLLKEKAFKGINVTIPYKQFVIPLLDEVNENALKIHAVNTIINKDGKLYGYNTDYGGLKKMILDHKINPKGKVCAILGNGGTHNTSKQLLTDMGAKEIITVTRKKEANTISFEEFKGNKEVELIINTTPVGMFPNNHNALISIDDYPHLKYLVDVVYNPLRTPLVLDAKAHGLISTGGLEMLVNQAVIANEIFFNRPNDSSLYKSIYKKLYFDKANIVLMGLPMSGKTTIGKALAQKMNKQFIDTDEEIIKKIGMPISEYFSLYGEDSFRKVETEVTAEVAKLTNVIISTGGGIIKNKINMTYFKENGFIVLLTRDDDLLVYDDKRPLTKSKEDYDKLKKERTPLYQKYEDAEIKNNGSIEDTLQSIQEVFYESINY